MNEYQKMLHEIEAKKQQLEQRIAAAVQAELSQWQQENSLPIRGVYIDLGGVLAKWAALSYMELLELQSI